MHRSARRDPLALMITAMLLGTVAGTSVGLLQGGGAGPGAAPAQAATAAPPSSAHAAAAPHPAAFSSRSSGSAPAEQRLNVPRRQLDRAKAGKPEHKEPGGSGKRPHGDGHDKDKGKQAHDH